MRDITKHQRSESQEGTTQAAIRELIDNEETDTRKRQKILEEEKRRNLNPTKKGKK